MKTRWPAAVCGRSCARARFHSPTKWRMMSRAKKVTDDVMCEMDHFISSWKWSFRSARKEKRRKKRAKKGKKERKPPKLDWAVALFESLQNCYQGAIIYSLSHSFRREIRISAIFFISLSFHLLQSFPLLFHALFFFPSSIHIRFPLFEFMHPLTLSHLLIWLTTRISLLTVKCINSGLSLNSTFKQNQRKKKEKKSLARIWTKPSLRKILGRFPLHKKNPKII